MLDIIVPCYNEGKNVKEFYEKASDCLKTIKHTFIFIDDGSTDETLGVLNELYKSDKEKIRIVSFSRNFGKEAALYAGFSHSKGNYTAVIDADLQQNPKYLVKMYNFLEENKEYDSIAMCQKKSKKRLLQEQFYKIMNLLSDVHVENGASDFRMFRSKVIASILSLCEKNRFSKGIFSYVGFKTYYDEYIAEKRNSGETKFGPKRLFNYAANGIIAFSIKPLRFVAYTGLLTVMSAFIYILIIIIKAIFSLGNISDFAGIICVILFTSGLILIGLGIVGEYVGKIYNETKNRPIFIIKEKTGFDENIL